MPEPEQVRGWLKTLWPVAERAGPALTMALLVVLVVSSWWLASWMHTCVDRNRELTERLITQQQTFMQELRLALAHCQREP